MDRLEELNNFLKHIVARPRLFNLSCVHAFFDVNEKETKISATIEKYAIRNYEYILRRMKRIYPQFVEVR